MGISYWIFLTSSIIVTFNICAFVNHKTRDKGDHLGCYVEKSKAMQLTGISIITHTILVSLLFLGIFVVPLWLIWANDIDGANFDALKRQKTLIKIVLWTALYAFGVILSVTLIFTKKANAHRASAYGYFGTSLCLVNQFKRIRFPCCKNVAN